MAHPEAGGGRVLPLRARLYLWLIAGLGVATLAAAARAGSALPPRDLALAVSLVVLAALAQHFLLEVGSHHKIDMSLAADFAALLLFPPAAAIVVVGLAQALGQATLALRRNPATGRRRRGLRGILFNTGQLVVATALGALVYRAAGLPELLAVPASAVVLYLANYFAVQVILWLEGGLNVRAAATELARQSPEFAALCLVGLVTAIAAHETMLAPLLMALPTAGLYIVQQQTTESMARERVARAEAEAASQTATRLAEQTAGILTAAREAIVKTDLEERIEFANPSAAELIGCPPEDLVGRELDEFVHFTSSENGVVSRCDGRPVPIDYTAARIADGEVIIVHDISARLEAERSREMLARAEKLRALGQMASGIAHDLNQSLALISGYAQLARDELEGVEGRLLAVASHLDVILSAANDSAETARRLLAWTRTAQPAAGTLVDFEQVLPEVARMTAPLLREAPQAEAHPVQLQVDVSGPAVIEGNSSSLREALTNLVFNAVDAMPDGGSITLRARHRPDGVLVEVADTGKGIPPDVRGHIFEPFFTTKGKRASGLGLAQVMAAAEQHHARLEVESAAEQGTTFRLLFPTAGRTESVTWQATAPSTRAAVQPLRILAVDDEEPLARLAATMLSSQGHTVTTATSGEQALTLLGDVDRLDLVISDVSMGAGMDGWELADKLRERYPGVWVVLATDWGEVISPEEAAAHGVQAVIAKPYRAPQLADLVALIASSALPARDLSIIAAAFELPPADVLIDARLIEARQATEDELFAELARRHGWDASVPPQYVRNLSLLLRRVAERLTETTST
jgi:PAS domain S-box-containing protein